MIEKWVTETVADLCCVEEHTITMQSKFIDDLGMDSLDVSDMIGQAEERFGIIISTDMLINVITIQDAVECIERAIL